MHADWIVPVEAEPHADPDHRRGRHCSLKPVCASWIEVARGLLSARRWPAGTLAGSTRTGRAAEGET